MRKVRNCLYCVALKQCCRVTGDLFLFYATANSAIDSEQPQMQRFSGMAVHTACGEVCDLLVFLERGSQGHTQRHHRCCTACYFSHPDWYAEDFHLPWKPRLLLTPLRGDQAFHQTTEAQLNVVLNPCYCQRHLRLAASSNNYQSQ